MKKFIYIFLLFSLVKTSFGQYAFFDSSYTLISSPEFNYKNPVFYKGNPPINYFITDCLFAYERYNSTSTSIIARLITDNNLYPEHVIVDNNDSNRNPTIAYANFNPSNNPGMLVYQSNQSGVWKLYYSIFNGTSWTLPQIVFNDNLERINPSICVTEDWGSMSGYVLAFESNNKIFISLFSNNQWSQEFLVSADSNSITKTPAITTSPYTTNIYVAYLKVISDTMNLIQYRSINVNYPSSINMNTVISIQQDFNSTNLRGSMGMNYSMFDYDYHTDQKTISYSVVCKPLQYSIYNQTGEFSGNTFYGSGSVHGDITDNFSHYSAFGCMNYVNDSLFVLFPSNYWPYLNKKFLITPSIEEINLSLSPKIVRTGTNAYRIRAVWNDIENGKYVLKTSYRDGALSGIIKEQTNVPVHYLLEQNFPNPFNPETKIKFSIPEISDVQIKIFNSLGNEIKIYNQKNLLAGSYFINVNMESFSSGVYFYRLITKKFQDTRKMILLK